MNDDDGGNSDSMLSPPVPDAIITPLDVDLHLSSADEDLPMDYDTDAVAELPLTDGSHLARNASDSKDSFCLDMEELNDDGSTLNDDFYDSNHTYSPMHTPCYDHDMLDSTPDSPFILAIDDGLDTDTEPHDMNDNVCSSFQIPHPVPAAKRSPSILQPHGLRDFSPAGDREEHTTFHLPVRTVDASTSFPGANWEGRHRSLATSDHLNHQLPRPSQSLSESGLHTSDTFVSTFQVRSAIHTQLQILSHPDTGRR